MDERLVLVLVFVLINSINRWVIGIVCSKAIEVQMCDITDVGGEAILDCLKFNKTLVVFDASHNYKISNKIHKKIQMILSTEPDNYDSMPKISNFELRYECFLLKV